MKRSTFLTISSSIALLVGLFAAFAPRLVLASKGVPPEPGTLVWVREVGVAILAIGGIGMAARRHHSSPTLRVLLLGLAAHQLMLAPIEVLAWLEGTIPVLAGIVPNTILHVTLAGAFFFYGWAIIPAANEPLAR